MCGICGIVGVADEQLAQADGGPDGASRPRRRGRRRASARDGGPPVSSGPSTPEHHRPNRPRRAADDLGSRATDDHLQRRDLQLPRAQDASSSPTGSGFHPTATPKCCVALYARDGAGAARPAERHLRFRDLGRGAAASCSWPATDSASSRSTTRRSTDRLVFASEIKAMLPALPRPSLRREALLDYLTFLWVPDPDTLFRGHLEAAARALRDVSGTGRCRSVSTGT